MPHDSTESGAFRFKRLSIRAEMFLWSSTVYHHDDYGVGLRHAEVGRDCPAG